MHGDEHKSAPAQDEDLRLGGGRNSEIPTDPSAPSLHVLSAVEADGAAPTDPSHPSHPSPSSSARPATAVERGPRSSLPSPAAGAPGKSDEHDGKVFGGKYRVEKLIAKGGMGRVYRATQFPLERPVAIKILNREFQKTDPQFVRRFFLEASTAAKLNHPHTITIFDYGEADSGELYIAMELLKGRPLSKVISSEGPFTPERALKISIQICRALREAHAMGIIHRDLKPGNVFLLEDGDEPDYAKVLDFGLVKLFRPESESKQQEAGILGEGDPELTRTGTLLGSPKYMSPEQIQGHPLDPRTDIYSFGVILFQMIAGKAPFTGATGVDVIYKHVHLPLPAISDVAPEVETPAVMEAIIQRCLKKQREDRYASMEELVSALKEAARMITSGILSPDSVAEPASPLVEDARRVAKARATSSRSGRSEPPTSVPPIVREAAFREPGLGDEATPIDQDRSQQARIVPVKSSRAPLAIAMLGVVLAAGVAVYGMTAQRPAPAEPAPAITPPSTRVEKEVEFLSEPAGARVFEAGRPLGVTPFKKTFSIDKEAEEPREFVFRLDGFEESVRSVLLDGKIGSIAAKLDPEVVAEPAAEEFSAEPQETEDKDRPAKNGRRKRPASNRDAKDPNSPYRLNPY